MCINIWCIQIFVVNNMTDSDDSDCGVGIVRLKSVQSEWEMAPETTEFKLKVRSDSGEIKKYIYALKIGSPLPYKASVPGVLIFSRDHDVTIQMLH